MRERRRLGAAMVLCCLAACVDAPSLTEPGAIDSEVDRVDAVATVRLEVPDDHPGNPFYALVFEGLDPASPHFFFPHADGWGAAFFEREIGCVPPDFNLLVVFDLTPAFPGGPPRPFLCPLTVEGHQIWRNPPTPIAVDPGPIQVRSLGLGAVPVILARWEEIETAMADGVLTLPELRGLPSAVEASADRFVALYVNGPAPDDRLMNRLEASGLLPGGGAFRVLAVESPAGTRYQVSIR